MTSVIALDVNETLSDMTAIAPRLEEVRAPPDLFTTWFASTLRDGFALTAAGAYDDFATVAQAALTSLLAALLQRGGVAQYLERLLSVEEVRRWKPAAEQCSRLPT